MEAGYILEDRKGKDFRTIKIGREYVCEKKKSDTHLCRKDRSLKGSTKEELLESLLKKK